MCVLLCSSQKLGSVHHSILGHRQGFAMGWCHRLRHCSAPAGTKEATTTLHVLALLRDLLPCFPAAVVKTCCETLLRVMTLSHVVSVLMIGMAREHPFTSQLHPGRAQTCLGAGWEPGNAGCKT